MDHTTFGVLIIGALTALMLTAGLFAGWSDIKISTKRLLHKHS